MLLAKNLNSGSAQFKPMQSTPPGKIKLALGLKKLLEKKGFQEITTAEISRISSVNESLIYRYFKDKRGMLQYILAEQQKESLQQIYSDLVTITGAYEKLKKLIWRTLDNFRKDIIFAKILLIEVRNDPAFYTSETYSIIKEYCQLIRSLVQEGINNGEFQKDVEPWFVMQILLGSIEHIVLPSLIFNKKYDVDLFAENIYRIVFKSILTKEN